MGNVSCGLTSETCAATTSTQKGTSGKCHINSCEQGCEKQLGKERWHDAILGSALHWITDMNIVTAWTKLRTTSEFFNVIIAVL